MFTGIVAQVGTVRSVTDGAGSRAFDIEAAGFEDALIPGGSVAIDGCCLTATSIRPAGFRVDAVETTLSRTTLGEFQVGREVNLEPALSAGQPLGGHLVQGHVDSVGTVTGLTEWGTTGS